MADLCKIGLKMREWHFRELSSLISQGGSMSLTTLHQRAKEVVSDSPGASGFYYQASEFCS